MAAVLKSYAPAFRFCQEQFKAAELVALGQVQCVHDRGSTDKDLAERNSRNCADGVVARGRDSRNIGTRRCAIGMANRAGRLAARSDARKPECHPIPIRVMARLLVHSRHSRKRAHCYVGSVRKFHFMAADDQPTWMAPRSSIYRCVGIHNRADSRRLPISASFLHLM